MWYFLKLVLSIGLCDKRRTIFLIIYVFDIALHYRTILLTGANQIVLNICKTIFFWCDSITKDLISSFNVKHSIYEGRLPERNCHDGRKEFLEWRRFQANRTNFHNCTLDFESVVNNRLKHSLHQYHISTYVILVNKLTFFTRILLLLFKTDIT